VSNLGFSLSLIGRHQRPKEEMIATRQRGIGVTRSKLCFEATCFRRLALAVRGAPPPCSLRLAMPNIGHGREESRAKPDRLVPAHLPCEFLDPSIPIFLIQPRASEEATQYRRPRVLFSSCGR